MFGRRGSDEDSLCLDQKNFKSKINKNLSYIVKEVQKEFPAGSPVVAESKIAQYLCSIIESAFIHGLKSSYYVKDSSRTDSKESLPKPQFWNILLKISHTETIKRVEELKFVTSKIGKCRAWLRIALNDGAITSYLATILSKEQRSLVRRYYNNYALFLDEECADIYLRQLHGIETLPFDLSYNSSVLNDWTKTPLELAGVVRQSSSVPLYVTLQSNSSNDRTANLRANNKHRGSAPAILLRNSISSSLPVTSGEEWLQKYGNAKDNSPGHDGPIKEEDEPKEKEDEEESVLHQRKLIKKRRKKSLKGSWETISTGSGPSRPESARNTPRTGSFCETPPVITLKKNPSAMVETMKNSSSFGSRQVGDSVDSSATRKERKNKNLTLHAEKEKSSSNSSEKSSEDGINFDPLRSASLTSPYSPQGDTTENPFDNTSSERSSRESASDSSKKTSPTHPDPKTGSSSSGSENPHKGQNPDNLLPPDGGDDVMNRSAEAIDIYSLGQPQKPSSLTKEELSFDFIPSGRLGNSLSMEGGWSLPNTPEVDQRLSPKSQKSSSEFGSSVSQNAISSLEEAHEQVKWSAPENLVQNVADCDANVKNETEIFIRREGYLKKMGDKLKQWKARWFVLRAKTLTYYKDEHSSKPMGVIDLSDVLSMSENKYRSGVDIVMTMNDGTKHSLTAKTKSLTLDWAADFRLVLNDSDPPVEEDDKKVEQDEDIYSQRYLEEYEVISIANQRMKGSNTSWYSSMVALMGKIANEKGLDAQNYQCADCASPIGIIYGPPRVCTYTGQYYCSQCHVNDEMQIPARIIHNWDFRKHRIAKRSKSFLGQVFSDPLLNLNEMNPGIYKYIDDMGKVLQLRQQLVHLKPYLETCRRFKMDDVINKLGSRPHFLEDCHLYSIQDLCNVNDKSVQSLLTKIVANGKKHVYNCPLCSAKGFVCEICNANKVIFPFETDTTIQCHECKSVFHRECKTETCPKCERRQQRLLEATEQHHQDSDDSA